MFISPLPPPAVLIRWKKGGGKTLDEKVSIGEFHLFFKTQARTCYTALILT
jgi:hypothetical protein